MAKSTSDMTLGGNSVKSDASWQPSTLEQAQISENIASIEVPAASAALITSHEIAQKSSGNFCLSPVKFYLLAG